MRTLNYISPSCAVMGLEPEQVICLSFTGTSESQNSSDLENFIVDTPLDW